MKKLLLVVSVFAFSIIKAQTLTDTGQIRTYVNANIVTNGTKAITAVTLNKILNGYLNAWPSSGISTINATSPLVWNSTTKTLSLPGYNATNWNSVYNWWVATGGGASTIISTHKLFGRASSGTGPGEEITLGSNLSLTGNVLNATGGSSVTLPTNKLGGRYSTGTGTIEPINIGTGLTLVSGTLNADAANKDTIVSATKINSFDNVAEMRASNIYAQGSKLAFTRGYYTVNDGGGATYVWIPSETHADDGGKYIKPALVSGAGRWVLQYNGIVNIRTLGAVNDAYYGGPTPTDNYPIIKKAISYFPATQIPNIYIPAVDSVRSDGLGNWYYVSYWNEPRTVRIHGGGENAVLLFDGTKGGIRLKGDGSLIENVTLRGNLGGVSAHINSDTAIGLWLNSNNSLADHVTIRNFDGDGIYLAGDEVAGTNSNLSKAQNCKVYGNGRANVHTKGGDANAQIISGMDCQNGGRFNYWLQDFLGNTLIGLHSASGANGNNYNKTIVTYSGQNYWALQDNINVTPGTNPAIWAPVTFGNLFGSTWNSTTQYLFGAGYYLDGANQQGVLLGCYTEGDEYGVIQNSNDIVLGGFAAGYGSFSGAIGNNGGVITSPSWQSMNYNISTRPSVGMNLGGGIPTMSFADNISFPMGFAKVGHDKIATTWATLGSSYNQFWAGRDETNWQSQAGWDRVRQSSDQGVFYVNGLGSRIGKIGDANWHRLVAFADNVPTSGDFGVGDILYPSGTARGSFPTLLYWQCSSASTAGNGGTWIAYNGGGATTTSGTYTPTLTNNANISSSTPYTCHYMRVGNEVTVSGKVGITPTAGSTTTQLFLNVPVTTANFSAQEQAGGTAYFQNGSVSGTGKIQANPSNQTVSLIFYSNGTGVADFSFTFQYTIQ